MQELERKFLLKKLPNNLNNPIRYERYFIYNGKKTQIRIQKKGNSFELEIKTKVNDLLANKKKLKLSKFIFNILKKVNQKENIIRDSYFISDNPNTTVKAYKDKYEGLIRLEVEFNSVTELKKYIIPKDAKEITGTDLANDNKLIKLNREEFVKELKEQKNRID